MTMEAALACPVRPQVDTGWLALSLREASSVDASHAKKDRLEHVKDVDQAPRRQRNAHSARGDDDAAHPPKPRAASCASDFSATYLAPNVVAVRHWERLCGGLVRDSPALPWSILLRRTFEVDVLECAKCHGGLRVLGAVEDPLVARALLEQLGLPTDAPAQPRARDPSTLDGEDPTDDRDELSRTSARATLREAGERLLWMCSN